MLAGKIRKNNFFQGSSVGTSLLLASNLMLWHEFAKWTREMRVIRMAAFDEPRLLNYKSSKRPTAVVKSFQSQLNGLWFPWGLLLFS